MSHITMGMKEAAKPVFKRAMFQCGAEQCSVYRKADELFLLYEYVPAFGSLLPNQFVCKNCYHVNGGEQRAVEGTITLKDVGKLMPIIYAIGLIGEDADVHKE